MFILLIIVGAAWYEKTPIMARGVQNNTPVQSLFCKYIINYKIDIKMEKNKKGVVVVHDQRFICVPGEYLPFTDG